MSNNMEIYRPKRKHVARFGEAWQDAIELHGCAWYGEVADGITQLGCYLDKKTKETKIGWKTKTVSPDLADFLLPDFRPEKIGLSAVSSG